MLSIGTGNIIALHRGDIEFQKVYLGDTLVFQKTPSRLPEGYTEVEYISNPNLTYIEDLKIPYETGSKLYNGYRHEFVVKFLNSTDSNGDTITGKYYYYKPTSGSASTNDYRLYRNLDTLILSPAKRSITSPYPVTQDKSSIIIDLAKEQFVFNGGEPDNPIVSINTTSVSTKYPLFARNYYSRIGNAVTQRFEFQSNFQFYGLKVYASTAAETGDLLCDFIPCIDPNGDVGLYDIVRDLFFTHGDTEKAFVAGPAV